MNRISALILDWAGTTVDFGSFAPTQIFVEAFRQAFDIEITLEEARVPMGLGKWQHIEALGKLPAVDKSWYRPPPPRATPRTTGSPPMTLPPAVVRARGWRCRT